ncbi:MAG: hypothetical protein J6V71_01995 [Clostridia bacterium]|nr:hypothetical protein [Clostridia bacterium]
MLNTILTPTVIWKNFLLPDSIDAQIINQEKSASVSTSKIMIEGRKVKDGTVKIYAELSRNEKNAGGSVVLLLEDFSINQNKTLVNDLLSKGYAVLTIDLAGQAESKEFFTSYPASISYANYENVKDKLYEVKSNAKATCWYEWCAVLRYALKFLKTQDWVTGVGGLAFSDVATALWHVAGMDKNLDCAVFGLNSGWQGYKGLYKFSGAVEPQFSDERYKFIAGVDVQSYAMHVTCPTLLLCATNSNKFDVDRACDTLAKMPKEVYSAVHYSVNYIDRIDHDAYNNAILFFKKFLQKGDLVLPSDLEIKADVVDGKIQIDINTEEKDVEKINVYAAQEYANPELRGWHKISVGKGKDGKYSTTYLPFAQSELSVLFATLEDKNGYIISSNIVGKRYKEEEIDSTYKNNVLYSSRQSNAHTIFFPANSSRENPDNVNVFDKGKVKVKKGPMGIEGVGSSAGLLSFIIGSKKYKPNDRAMFMIDVYAKEKSTLTIKLITNYFGNKVEYISNTNVLGGEVWHNVQIDMNKFKTVDGLPLKEYSKVQAIEIDVKDTEFLINNALWV